MNCQCVQSNSISVDYTHHTQNLLCCSTCTLCINIITRRKEITSSTDTTILTATCETYNRQFVQPHGRNTCMTSLAIVFVQIMANGRHPVNYMYVYLNIILRLL